MRFYGFVFMAFVTAFVGFMWASRGFPTTYPNLAMKSGAPAPRPSEQRNFEREAWVASKTNESDKDPERDRLRMETLQAANAYSLSPCDPTMKANLVKALTAYTEAYIKRMNCSVMMFCDYHKQREATVAFSTPLDTQVRKALDEAFDSGGISTKDFPGRIGFEMQHLAGYRHSDPLTCVIPNRAGARVR